MYCDYGALSDLTATMKSNFDKVKKSLDSIESSMKSIANEGSWQSEARNYFHDQSDKLFDDINTAENRFRNTIMYLENVVNNYKSLDK